MPQKPLLGELINWNNPLSKGLHICLPFNERSGEKIIDISGNQNNGVFSKTLGSANSPEWVPDGLNFLRMASVADSRYITVANMNGQQHDAYTILSWYKSRTSLGAADDEYIAIWTAGGGAEGFILGGTDDTVADREARFLVGDGVGAMSTLYSTKYIKDEKWHQVVGTVNAAVGTQKLYVDGLLDGINTGINIDTDVVNADFNIGDDPGNTEELDGMLALVMFWRRELTALEIQQLYIDPYAIFRYDIAKAITEEESSSSPDESESSLSPSPSSSSSSPDESASSPSPSSSSSSPDESASSPSPSSSSSSPDESASSPSPSSSSSSPDESASSPSPSSSSSSPDESASSESPSSSSSSPDESASSPSTPSLSSSSSSPSESSSSPSEQSESSSSSESVEPAPFVLIYQPHIANYIGIGIM